VEGKPTRKIINIIGRGIGAEDAPNGVESWGVNIVMLRRPVDVGFDMHEDGKMNDKQVERRRQQRGHAQQHQCCPHLAGIQVIATEKRDHAQGQHSQECRLIEQDEQGGCQRDFPGWMVANRHILH